MSKFLGNRWGKMMLALLVCFGVFGLTAMDSYAEQCCACYGLVGISKGSFADCSSACLSIGKTALAEFTLRTDTMADGTPFICSDECSAVGSTCSFDAQKLCYDDSTHTNNYYNECYRDIVNAPYFKCTPDDATGWQLCPNPGTSGVKEVCCIWGGNWDEGISKTTKDESCACVPDPYAK